MNASMMNKEVLFSISTPDGRHQICRQLMRDAALKDYSDQPNTDFGRIQHFGRSSFGNPLIGKTDPGTLVQ